MTIFAFLVIARWVHFSAVFVLFGAALFWLYIPASASAQATLPRSYEATRRLFRGAAPVAALSGIAWLAGILVNIASDPAAPDWGALKDPEFLRLFFFETNFGAVWLIRLILLGGAIGVVALRLPERIRLIELVFIGAALLVSQAWLGHAAEGGAGLYGAAVITAYCVHVLAAGAWVGGLAPLLFTLVEQRRAEKDLVPETLQILARFSAMGMTAATLIVVSGATNAGFRVGGSFGRLLDTRYSDTLFVKLALVALMLALALFNRMVLMPRLRLASVEAAARTTAVEKSVATELILGILVLGAAAVLGITPPPN
jgi:putative copper resistance protein D